MTQSLTSFSYSLLELGESRLREPGCKAEREAPRDFVLLQLVPHGLGGVSLTSIQILFPGRAFSQVTRSPTAF